MWLYEHIDETRKQLLSKNIIDLSGKVDEDMAMYVRDALMMLTANNNPAIKVIITSGGGNVTVSLAIYDMLKNYPGKKTGLVISFCRSMAVVILQACDERLALPHSLVGVHSILVDIEKLPSSITFTPKKILEFVEKVVKDARSAQGIIENIYRRRTGQTLKAIRQVSNKDYDMTAQEALTFGLIDAII